MLSDADKRIYHGDEEDQDSEDQDDTNVTNNKKKTKPYTIEEDKKVGHLPDVLNNIFIDLFDGNKNIRFPTNLKAVVVILNLVYIFRSSST